MESEMTDLAAKTTPATTTATSVQPTAAHHQLARSPSDNAEYARRTDEHVAAAATASTTVVAHQQPHLSIEHDRNSETPIVPTDDDDEEPKVKPKKKKFLCLRISRHGLGIVLILIVACIWVAASEFIQVIFGELSFSKPFFLTYFNTAFFMSWNLGFLISPTWRQTPLYDTSDFAPSLVEPAVVVSAASAGAAAAAATTNHHDNDDQVPLRREEAVHAAGPAAAAEAATTPERLPREGGAEETPTLQRLNKKHHDAQQAEETEKTPGCLDGSWGTITPYSIASLVHCAAMFCPLWFLANVLFNYSLSTTSVASNTILSTTSCVWAMLFSYILLHERIKWFKIIAIVLSLGGAAMVGFGSKDASAQHHIEGDILALVSAIFYAGYTTVLRWCLPDEKRYYMGMCFGFVGVINTCVMWPGFIVLSLLDVEPFELPHWLVLGALAINGIVGTNLSDVLWAKSVVLTSPLVATLGLSLTIPLAMIADYAFRDHTFTLLYIMGAVCVALGFVVANL